MLQPVTTPVSTTQDAPTTPLAAAVDQARAALLEEVAAADVGEHLDTVAEDELVVTHRFACTKPGYVGWTGRSPWPAPPTSRTSPSTRSCWCPGDQAILAPGLGALPRADPAR